LIILNVAGMLACLDGYMNIAMEQTEVYDSYTHVRICNMQQTIHFLTICNIFFPPLQEYVDGQLKNKYGDCFIRGNNVLYISTTKQ
jgi:U6 snRNA-associated Sm-like protein LSm6